MAAAPNSSGSSASDMMYQLFTATSSDEPLSKRGKVEPVGGKKQPRRSNKTEGGGGKPNPLISPTEKCKVCLEPAAKHIHYGAVTCFSCRAFFRRSIQNHSSDAYKCRKEGHCDVSLKARKSCQKCRFEKCQEVRRGDPLMTSSIMTSCLFWFIWTAPAAHFYVLGCHNALYSFSFKKCDVISDDHLY